MGLGLVLVALLGCAPPARLDPPAEIAYGAAILPEPLQVTPLLPRDRFVFAARPGSRALVVGWSAAQLEGLVPADDRPLEPTTACGSRLPRPSWVKEIGAGGEPRDPPEPFALELTAPSLRDRCPPEKLAEVDVAVIHSDEASCTARIVREPPCGFRVVPEGLCSRSSTSAFEGRIDRDGEVCLAPESGCAKTDAPGAYRCGRVTVGFVPPEPAVKVDTVTVIPREELEHGITPPMGEAAASASLELGDKGYLFDFVVAGGKLVVASGQRTRTATRSTWQFCPSWMNGRPSRLDVYDQETLALEGTYGAPTCLTRLAPNPRSQSSFYGVSLLGTRPTFHEIDLRGRIVKETKLPVPGDRLYPYPVEIVAPPGTTRVAVLLGGGLLDAAFPVVERVAVLETPALAWTSTAWSAEASHATGMSALERGAVLIVEAGARDLIRRRIDPAVPPVEPAMQRLDVRSTSVDLGRVAYLADQRIALVTSAEVRPGLYEVPPDAAVIATFVRSPFAAAKPMDIAPWRPAGFALIASLVWSVPYVEGSPPQDPAKCFDRASAPSLPCAALQLYDLGAHRFGEPVIVGYGIPSRMRVDARGRVWVLLPWSAQVARVTPL